MVELLSARFGKSDRPYRRPEGVFPGQFTPTIPKRSQLGGRTRNLSASAEQLRGRTVNSGPIGIHLGPFGGIPPRTGPPPIQHGLAQAPPHRIEMKILDGGVHGLFGLPIPVTAGPLLPIAENGAAGPLTDRQPRKQSAPGALEIGFHLPRRLHLRRGQEARNAIRRRVGTRRPDKQVHVRFAVNLGAPAFSADSWLQAPVGTARASPGAMGCV